MPTLFLQSPIDPRSPQRDLLQTGLAFERFTFKLEDPTHPGRVVAVRDHSDTEDLTSGLAQRVIDASHLEDWPAVHAAVVSGRGAWEDPWFERPERLFVVRMGPVPPEIEAIEGLGSGPLRLIEIPRAERARLFERLFRSGTEKIALIADPTPELLARELPLRLDGSLAEIVRASIRFDRLGTLLRSCAWVAASHGRAQPAPRCLYAAHDLGPALRAAAAAEPLEELCLEQLLADEPAWPGPDLVLDGPRGIDEQRLRRSVAVERLSIRGAKLTSFAALSGLTRLRHLAIDRLPLDGAAGAHVLGSLGSVDLSGYRGDPSFLAQIPSLERLSVNSTATWPDIRALLAALQLRHLSLDHPKVDDLAWLPATLESLVLSRVRVDSLAALTRLVGLRELWVDSMAVSDIQPLAELPALERVGIARSLVSDLSPLSALPSLRHLAVELLPVRSLPKLPALTSLRLAFVELSGLEVLRDLTSLRSIELVDIGVREVAPLAALEHIEHVRWVGPPPHDLDRLDPRVRFELVA